MPLINTVFHATCHATGLWLLCVRNLYVRQLCVRQLWERTIVCKKIQRIDGRVPIA